MAQILDELQLTDLICSSEIEPSIGAAAIFKFHLKNKLKIIIK